MAYSSQNTYVYNNILMWLTVFSWIIVYHNEMNKVKFYLILLSKWECTMDSVVVFVIVVNMAVSLLWPNTVHYYYNNQAWIL